MINKFNLSWLRFLVGSTSLFYIAGASILSCFIIFYFISGTLAFLLLCGIVFGELCNFALDHVSSIFASFQDSSTQFRTIYSSIPTSVPIELVFHRPKSTDCHLKSCT